jgi:glyoxylase-like metal-dependent hydrolase (beta-lactamase superfamily II)
MKQVAAGINQLLIQRFVNVYFVEAGAPGEWVLVDTGLPGSTKNIIAAANELFYPGTHPQAILLTHGHMDHAGSAQELADHWKVPIYAHRLEMPFLTGKAVYPPADPTVEGGGSLAFASRFFPPQTFNLTNVQALPEGGEVPFMPGWQCIHVPGHAPGQVAFFRTEDKTLLGADAFATTEHDSVLSVLLGTPKISRAGTPFNFDWEATHASVVKLSNLEPQAIGCGHGPALQGAHLAEELRQLALHFPVPHKGRYVDSPARTDENGVEFIPPALPDTLPARAAMLGGGIALATLAAVVLTSRKSKGKQKGKLKGYRPAPIAARERPFPDYPYKEKYF